MREYEITNDSTKMDIALRQYPEHYKIGEAEYFRDQWDNKTYLIDQSGVSHYRTFDFGDRNCTRFIMSGNGLEKRGSSIVLIERCLVSNGNVWMRYLLDKYYNHILLSDSGECMFHSIGTQPLKETTGIPIDADSGITVWPTCVDENSRVAGIIYPGNLEESELESLSAKLNKKITSDDNPVIAIIH